MQFCKLFQLFVDLLLRIVSSVLFRPLLIMDRERYILFDNSLDIFVFFRIHSLSRFFVVKFDNLSCIVHSFFVSMGEYLSHNVMSWLQVLELRFFGNDFVVSSVVFSRFFLVLLWSVLALSCTILGLGLQNLIPSNLLGSTHLAQFLHFPLFPQPCNRLKNLFNCDGLKIVANIVGFWYGLPFKSNLSHSLRRFLWLIKCDFWRTWLDSFCLGFWTAV